MIKHRFVVRLNGQPVIDKEGNAYELFREAEGKITQQLWQAFMPGGWQNLRATPVGTKAASNINISVAWECTFNGRAPARPKHVIAAEKAAQAAKGQARREREAKWRAEAEQKVINMRERIKRQVDYAFSQGKTGTEPAAKYITCQHCDGPAAVVCLNQPVARGASVLDEDTIVGALCAAHIQHSPYSYYTRYSRNDVFKVECSKLEFFYDGVRQIAIKAKP